MRKTIVLTWQEYSPVSSYYGTICAALWIAEGTDSDLNDALAYAAKQNRQPACAMAQYRVHIFATDNTRWKRDALEAHRNGAQV